MVLQDKFLRRPAAAGLWICASAAAAAPQPAFLPTGQVALPPRGFVEFCGRQPEDCGPSPALVLAGVRQADADRRALLSPVASPPGTASWKVQTGPPESARSVTAVFRHAPVDAASRRRALPALTPNLWAKLNRVNARVNTAMLQGSDMETQGREDLWSTPLKDGGTLGDCEDYVLEKRRALLDAGLPSAALNIAVVTTQGGETHAVLLVATRTGELVLDNLSPWIVGWRHAPYRWRQRQVGGETFTWAMAAASTTNERLRPGPAAATPAGSDLAPGGLLSPDADAP